MEKVDNIEVKDIKAYALNDLLVFCLQNLHKVLSTDLDKTRMVKFDDDKSMYVFYPLFNAFIALEKIYDLYKEDKTIVNIDWINKYEQLKTVYNERSE